MLQPDRSFQRLSWMINTAFSTVAGAGSMVEAGTAAVDIAEAGTAGTAGTAAVEAEAGTAAVEVENRQ